MISIIVATDEDLLIGKEGSSNGMPWNVPEDLKHFKAITVNQAILMGLTTYQAIGRPLPDRKTIVVSLEPFEDDRVEVRNSLTEVIEQYRQSGDDLFVSGGASIYKQCLPIADQLLISRIPGKHVGETYFPNFDEYGYRLVDEKPFKTFTLQTYKRG